MAQIGRLSSTLLVCVAFIAWLTISASLEVREQTWDVTQPRGRSRTIDFMTDEGTWMSIDVSPDGSWLVFDLLGQIYRLPISGGEAVALTENTGIALNFHPAISPDGRRIAFISDRGGQSNVWTMNVDGSNPRPVLTDLATRFVDPEWAPDGKSIVTSRVYRTPGRGWHRQTMTLWELPLEGGEPRQLLGGNLTHYEAPSFSPDGRYLYYHVSYSTGEGNGLLTTGHRIQRLELATGRAANVRGPTESAELSSEFLDALRRTPYAGDVEGDAPAALTPELSPDGRFLAFAQEVPGQTFSYRGHEFRPRTALYIRDLANGTERAVLDPANKDLTQLNAQYEYRPFPGYAWVPDGKSIVIGQGGKIRRVNVETGEVATIPFRARVHRVISEQVRGRITIPDSAFDVKFVQWPTGSPDGRRLAFVAVGRIWVMDLPQGTPRPLTTDMRPVFQLTPAWSPDAKEIAFTTWSDLERGHLWKVPATGGAPRRLTTESGEYLHPAWSPDGAYIAVTKGAGPGPGEWNGWNRDLGWTAVKVPASGGTEETIAQFMMLRAGHYGADGRLYFAHLRNPAVLSRLRWPFPDEESLSLFVYVRSVSPSSTQDHLRFPPRLRDNDPVLSPDGRWVAFDAGRSIFVARAPVDTESIVNPNPNEEVPGRIRIGDRGGAYHSWRDARTVQFGSGNRYITYDVATGKTTTVPIHLRIPRDVPRGTIALTGAKIITLEGDRIIAHGDVVVSGARIVCISESGRGREGGGGGRVAGRRAEGCDLSRADRVIDVTGKVIIPGLIDMHAHHTREASGVIAQHRTSSALDLAYGITTILDPAADSQSAFPLAEMIEAGLLAGPRTYSTAELVISHGYAWGDQREIHTYADAELHVNRRADWGAVSIKNYRLTNRREQQYLLEAARQRGITVTSEGGPLYFDVGLTMDGQTGWEHLLGPLPIYKDAALFFGQAGMVYSPTLIVAGHVNGSKEYFRPRQNLLEDARYLRFMSRAELQARTRSDRLVPKEEVSFPIVAQGLADIVRAGGHGSIGEHGEQPGIGSHWEVWAYAEALTPLEALRVASLDGAYFIGLHHETGSIKQGKLADLIILDADPLANIRNTSSIRYVMKAGNLYDASTLNRIWPDRQKFGPAPWERLGR